MTDDIVTRLRTMDDDLVTMRQGYLGPPPTEGYDPAIEQLIDEIERLRGVIADMECTCLPYARPHDGMCARCMALRSPKDGE